MIKCMKRCSTSITIREMQIIATMKYNYTSIRMTKTNKTKPKNRNNTKYWQKCRKLDHSCMVGRNVE